MKRNSENFEFNESYGSGQKRSRGEGEFEVRLLIPSKMAGSIIGRAGANIKELRSRNDANVRVPDNPGPERIMWIQSKDYQTAINVIDQSLPYMFEESSNKGRDTGSQEIRLLIHESIVGGIIGRGGSTINQIEKESGSKVHAYQTCAPQSSDRCVVVRGRQEQIITALNQIMTFLATREVQGVHNMYDPINFDCYYADVYGGYGRPSDAIGGQDMPMVPRGNVNNMPMGMPSRDEMAMLSRGNNMQSPGGSMYGGLNNFYPVDKGGMESVGIRNGLNNVASPNFVKEEPLGYGTGGTAFVPPTKDESGPVQTSKVTIPRDMGGAIIGPGGARIRKVRMDSQADIKVDEPEEGSDDRVITITGTPQSIQTAQYLLQQCVRTFGQRSSRGNTGY